MKRSLTREWIEAHKNYPHEDWCLIWPFFREEPIGRGKMGGEWAHRVMCEAVNGPPPPDKPQARHSCGNGDQGCVTPRHMHWGNNSQNQLDRTAHGRANTGKQHKFTPQQIADIRAKYGEFTQTKLAEMYGCSLGTIQYYLKYREERGHAGGLVEHWTPDEDEKLREALRLGYNFPQAATHVGRSLGATTAYAYRRGMRSGQAPRLKGVKVMQSNGDRA